MGPKNGEFKVQDFKTCKNKIEKWLKDCGRSVLKDEEKRVLADVICRLRDMSNKTEKRDWDNPTSKIWNQIRIWFGDDWSGKPFEN
jgi:hypothetical protein